MYPQAECLNGQEKTQLFLNVVLHKRSSFKTKAGFAAFAAPPCWYVIKVMPVGFSFLRLRSGKMLMCGFAIRKWIVFAILPSSTITGRESKSGNNHLSIVSGFSWRREGCFCTPCTYCTGGGGGGATRRERRIIV